MSSAIKLQSKFCSIKLARVKWFSIIHWQVDLVSKFINHDKPSRLSRATDLFDCLKLAVVANEIDFKKLGMLIDFKHSSIRASFVSFILCQFYIMSVLYYVSFILLMMVPINALTFVLHFANVFKMLWCSGACDQSIIYLSNR